MQAKLRVAAFLLVAGFAWGCVGSEEAPTGADSGPDASGADATSGSADSAPDSGGADATIDDAASDARMDSGTDSEGSVESAPETGVPAEAGSDAATCTNACAAGAMQCASNGGSVQKCIVQTNGCTQWTTSSMCGTHQTCSGTGAASTCNCVSSVCTQVGTTCQDAQTVATCQVDSDTCPYVSSTNMCTSPQSCSGMAPTAACSLTCTDSCTQGQQSCVGGLIAACTLGTNGCWAYGTPSSCVDVRQTCTGAAGSAQCTCVADPVCTSIAATCSGPSTAVTCTQDAYGCFYQASQSACVGQTPTCFNGGCAQCTPNDLACTGNTPEKCSSTGTWQVGTACTGTTPLCSAGSCISPPSCGPGGAGMTNCGTGSESCCVSLEVPSGMFDRTYTNSGSGASGLADPASVSGFRLDKYEVTVGRFRQFVKAVLPSTGTGWKPAAGSGKHTHLNGGQGLSNSGSAGTYEPGWLASDNANISPTLANLTTNCAGDNAAATWTSTAGASDKLPINCMTWAEAYAFCIWDGGFLPSEAEWEYTAAGGSNQLEYPGWGSTNPSSDLYADFDCNYPTAGGSCTGNTVNIAPVGTATLGVGLWGQLDLHAGSMNEWALDWYAAYVDPCTDCSYQTATTNRLERGGNWSGGVTTTALLPWTRSGGEAPASRLFFVGFRCARTP